MRLRRLEQFLGRAPAVDPEQQAVLAAGRQDLAILRHSDVHTGRGLAHRVAPDFPVRLHGDQQASFRLSINLFQIFYKAVYAPASQLFFGHGWPYAAKARTAESGSISDRGSK